MVEKGAYRCPERVSSPGLDPAVHWNDRYEEASVVAHRCRGRGCLCSDDSTAPWGVARRSGSSTHVGKNFRENGIGGRSSRVVVECSMFWGVVKLQHYVNWLP